MAKMRTMKAEFQEQIKSPKWQKRRLEIMQRDDFTCQICGDKETTLHVHHLHYVPNRDYWDYEDWELITLCEDCHKNEHDIEGILDYVKSLKQCGITLFEIECLLECIDIQIMFGRHEAILDITGDEVGASIEGNEIKRLTERRIKLLPNK